MLNKLVLKEPIVICDIGASPTDPTPFIDDLMSSTNSILLLQILRSRWLLNWQIIRYYKLIDKLSDITKIDYISEYRHLVMAKCSN